MDYIYKKPLTCSHVLLLHSTSFAAFALAITWLVYASSAAARNRASCCGNHTPCARFTCDIIWDSIFCAFWCAMLILNAISSSTGMAVVTGAQFSLLLATAVLSGQVRTIMIQNESKGPIIGEAAA
jgi:hypothetical protein